MAGIRELTAIVLAIGVAAIFLIVSGFVVEEVQDAPITWTCTAGGTENITANNVTAQTLTTNYLCYKPTMKCNATMLTTGEYTFDTIHSQRSDILLTNDTWNGTNCQVNYSHDARNSLQHNTTVGILASLGDFAGWFALIVLVVVAGIIIGILIQGFSGGNIK